MSRVAFAILACILVAGGLVTYRKWVQKQRMTLAEFSPGEPIGGRPPAPALRTQRPDGSEVALPGELGRPVIVHFWATWCTPCRAELPGLLAVGEALEREGQVHFYAVSVDDDWAEVRAHFGGDIPKSVVLAGQGGARLYGARSIPATFFVDRQGRLVERHVGAFDWSSAAARQYLERLP